MSTIEMERSTMTKMTTIPENYNAIRAAMPTIDPELALFDVKTMAERTELSLSSRRTSMLLSLSFGVLAVFLAAIGIYGVLSYLSRSAGVRLAYAWRWVAHRDAS